MGALRPVHIIIVLVIVLLLFGARRLPDLARSVGQSMKIFKEEVKDLTSGDDPAAAAPGFHEPTMAAGQAASREPAPPGVVVEAQRE